MLTPRLAVWTAALVVSGTGLGVACGTSGQGRAPPPAVVGSPGVAESSHPDQPHPAKSVIVPSDVPIGGGPMGRPSATGTSGSTTGSDLGKGTVGSGSQ